MSYFTERINKRLVKNGIKSIVFVLIIALLLVGLSQIFMPKTNKDMRDKSANGILGEPENTIDIVIVGDSESYSSVIPLQLYNEHGITSYVCGTPSQTLAYSLDFLRKTFEKQSPKIVMLETNTIFRAFTLRAAILTKADEYLPIYRYHDRWKKISLRDFQFNVENDYIVNDKGYRIETKISPADTKNYMKPTQKKELIKQKNKTYLKKIIDLCNANGAELMLFSTPSTKNWNYKRHNAVEELSKELNLEYIDLNTLTKEVPIDWSKETKDKGDHLNYDGAVKVTKYLGEVFSSKDIFEDHRINEAYKSWSKAYDNFIESYEKKFKNQN